MGAVKPGGFYRIRVRCWALGSASDWFHDQTARLIGDYFKNFAYLVDHSRKVPTMAARSRPGETRRVGMAAKI